SPFGQSLTGIRENTLRMHAVGAPVRARLVVCYTISAAIAGIAGGIWAQANAYVNLGTLGLDRAATVLIILVLGGAGRLYGAFAAARDIDFRLEAGARHALIGPNGAGKTTFVNLLTGLIPPTSGQVLLKGRDITGVAQAARVKLGIARTFQLNRLFRGLSVLDNVYLAVAERVGAASSMFRPAGLRRDVVE